MIVPDSRPSTVLDRRRSQHKVRVERCPLLLESFKTRAKNSF